MSETKRKRENETENSECIFNSIINGCNPQMLLVLIPFLGVEK